MENSYYPEGTLYGQGINSEYIGSLSGLEYAREHGIILEAKASMCDSSHNLYVTLGTYRGIIPKEEAAYSASGEPVKDIAVITRVGKPVSFVVTDIEKSMSGTVIKLSRRLAQKKCCEEYVSTLNAGDVIEACVTHMEQFGAFCDIGCGVIALLPVDCISVSRISHPAERFIAGQKLRAVIKDIVKDTFRVTLSHKELLGTWKENASMFEPGQTVTGIVRSIESYGIFVELSPNLAGLAEWCDGVSVGDCAAVYIKSIIPEKMKIKLVIVDIGCRTESVAPSVYFEDSPHIDEWRYSPEECSKDIISVF